MIWPLSLVKAGCVEQRKSAPRCTQKLSTYETRDVSQGRSEFDCGDARYAKAQALTSALRPATSTREKPYAPHLIPCAIFIASTRAFSHYTSILPKAALNVTASALCEGPCEGGEGGCKSSLSRVRQRVRVRVIQRWAKNGERRSDHIKRKLTLPSPQP
jgi:hypothetical protein